MAKINLESEELVKYFEEIGFRKNHAIVYLAFLKYGSLYMPEIVKKTGINRSYLYDILNELTEKGVIGYIIKNKNRIYYADDPNKIADIIKDKEKTISEFKTKYDELLPSLLLSNIATTKESVVVYEGKNGVKNIFEDIIKEGKDYVCFGGEGEFSKYFPTYADTFTLRCKKIKYKVVYSSVLRGKRPLPVQKKVICEIKFLPKEYEYPFAIYIYGDKTAIILWKSMLGIVIKGESTADGFEDYFDIIWKMAKE